MPYCTFFSRRDAEAFIPADANCHLISISDGPEDQARIDEDRWLSVSFHYFVDAGFDEEILEISGDTFEQQYRDYFLIEKAETLRRRIEAIALRGENIVVNCQAGRSRSAAVARYISTRHGYQLDKATPDANLCVYRMLTKDKALMAAYAAIVRPIQLPRKPGLFAQLKALFCS
ncbi:dual specificity protein phosphatase family protein [Azotobacter beijerinckii]|uniref:Dual specificity phosphatase, catalytic domain n=1 Tax=Azotobacter beijerinckii TaxID=170623 RepID=A0A1I4GVJ8_9GAMM|nr:dual specificity protein phosphatase family protein [Azotobacter beijerinckii]SFB63465.1 Dual specificity phosphatase, catalytic domain [Azotobacter beijerinckii]SFL34112.1 Dual specificity phosphatase, catalytic domain [Azotobacter beijerinckii]